RNNSNSPKAWSQNLNPITQKPTYPGGPPHRRGPAPNQNHNSNSAPARATAQAPTESNTPDMHANDRLLFLFAASIGLQATVTTKSGEKFMGIFTGVNREQNRSCFMLKLTRNAAPDSLQATSDRLSDVKSPFLGNAPDHAMTFDFLDIVDLYIPNVTSVPANPRKAKKAPDFKTDTDISGKQEIREKPLQRWEPEPGDAADLSLESAGTTTGWDQFAANERLFGARSTWDENLYTTKIDRTDPSYRQKAAEAARIARQIESGDVTNVHMREERGLTVEQDFDEEARYSGVQRTASTADTSSSASQLRAKTEDATFAALRSGGPGKYTAPARRAPPAAPTPPVTGVHCDPAIISATIAKPDSIAKQKQSQTQVQAQTQPRTKPATPAIPAKATQSSAEASPGVPTPARPAAASASAQSVKPKATADQQSTTASALSKPTTTPNVPAVPVPPVAVPRTTTTEAAPAITTTITTGKPAPTGSSRMESEVLENFRKFANSEKLKVQERRRNQVSYDRTIRLNELMKFSQNFKLGTPIPDDLVPILAKDPSKQEAIIEKARRQYEEKQNSIASKSTSSSGVTNAPASTTAAAAVNSSAPSDVAATTTGAMGPSAPAGSSTTTSAVAAAGLTPTNPAPEPRTPVRPVSGKVDNSYGNVYGGPNDRPVFGRGRGFGLIAPHPGNRPMSYQPPHTGRPASGHLSHRLANIQAEMHQQRK
ncbi:hypothetical protein KEM54_001617, partial [Ascosphaera aggregata]